METVAPVAASGRFDSEMNAPGDCRRCGACCFSPGEHYIEVTGHDWERLGPAASQLAWFLGNHAYMRMSRNHCAALRALRPAAGRRDFFCTIYDRRPQVCRDLGRGSPECDAERLLKAAFVEAAGEAAAPFTSIAR